MPLPLPLDLPLPCRWARLIQANEGKNAAAGRLRRGFQKIKENKRSVTLGYCLADSKRNKKVCRIEELGGIPTYLSVPRGHSKQGMLGCLHVLQFYFTAGGGFQGGGSRAGGRGKQTPNTGGGNAHPDPRNGANSSTKIDDSEKRASRSETV